jgi:hypothetical protein
MFMTSLSCVWRRQQGRLGGKSVFWKDQKRCYGGRQSYGRNLVFKNIKFFLIPGSGMGKFFRPLATLHLYLGLAGQISVKETCFNLRNCPSRAVFCPLLSLTVHYHSSEFRSSPRADQMPPREAFNWSPKEHNYAHLLYLFELKTNF